MTASLRRLEPGEAMKLRELRLRALTDASSAFAASVHDERMFPLQRWDGWARAGADGASTAIIVAVEHDRWVGMVAGRLLEDGVAWLEALWVDPQARRQRLGLRLIEAVADWARARGCIRLDLSVTTGNLAAQALYARAGFAPTGRRRPLPADPARIEVFLSRPL